MNSVITLVIVLAVAGADFVIRIPHDIKEYHSKIRYLPLLDERGNLYYEDLAQEVATTKPTPSDIKLYLHTPNRLDTPDLLPSNDASALSSTAFNPNLTNFFLIHGWSNNYQSDLNVLIKGAILSTTSANVFVVDWSNITRLGYVYAFAHLESVGEILGNYLVSVMDTYNVPSFNFRLIGHSMGGHAAGCIGAYFGLLTGSLLPSIVGLDPASLLFTINNIDNRLDPSDATFVQVIHTNAEFLGFETSIGHADYYPNGGRKQSGCKSDLLGMCSHARAYIYYAESISSSKFISHYCTNYADYTNGSCDKNHQSTMGQLYVDTTASGDYYLDTYAEWPFAQG